MKNLVWRIALTLVFATPICEVTTRAQEQSGQSDALINIQVSRSTEAVNYRDRKSTKIGFRGTALMPLAQGKAEVDARQGRVEINAEFKNVGPAPAFGPAYLTYVLWAISPEGRANNLGEVLLDGNKSKLDVTTKLQSFGMIITAEPYFAVTFPSDVVVMDNVLLKDTMGAVNTVDAKFELLQRGRYDNLHLEPMTIDPQVPLSLYEARNALRIARALQADKYAAETYGKALAALNQAEDYYNRKQKQAITTAARGAVQNAEDARAITVKRQAEEKAAQQNKAAEEQIAHAQAQEEAAKQQRTLAEQQRAQAEQQKMQAELATAKEATARAQAQAAQEAAQLKEQLAKQQAAQAAQQAAQANQQAQQAEREKQELRAKLLAQFNRVLPTTDTNRGLVVNMGDVLFDTGKYTLRQPAREALAKLSGIVLNYPGLNLQIEGYTDSTGSADFNQKLSEQRAGAVRDYLVQQGLDAGSITAKGFGESNPVADNNTADGRQKNRRVEIVVSGEVIGTKLGSPQ